MALDVFAETGFALDPSRIAQLDLVQDDVFKVTGGLIAKRENEFDVVPRNGH